MPIFRVSGPTMSQPRSNGQRAGRKGFPHGTGIDRDQENGRPTLHGRESDAAFGDNVFLAALANVTRERKGPPPLTERPATTVPYGPSTGIGRTNLAHHRSEGRHTSGHDSQEQWNSAKPPSYVGTRRLSGKALEGAPQVHEDLGLSVRCLSFGSPRIGGGYNSYMQILQTPQTVVVLQETIHDARMIPVDGSPTSAG